MLELRPPLMGRWSILLIFGIFAIAAVALVIATFLGGDGAPPPAFAVLWLAALGWNAYWWLFRIAFALRLDADSLRWEAPLRSGSIPLSALHDIRPMRMASNVEVVEHQLGRPVLVMATKGLGPFLEEVGRRRTDLPVRLGWQAQLSPRLPGWLGRRRG